MAFVKVKNGHLLNRRRARQVLSAGIEEEGFLKHTREIGTAEEDFVERGYGADELRPPATVRILKTQQREYIRTVVVVVDRSVRLVRTQVVIFLQAQPGVLNVVEAIARRILWLGGSDLSSQTSEHEGDLALIVIRNRQSADQREAETPFKGFEKPVAKV